MLTQRILFPRAYQVAVSVAAVQRGFPKAVIECCEIGPFRNRSFAATASSVSHADKPARRHPNLSVWYLRFATVAIVAQPESGP
jgi:hypothetical protein